MSSYTTKYRKEHPEYYEKERIIDRERVKTYIKIIQNTRKGKATSISKIL
jgi:hypothetical protein